MTLSLFHYYAKFLTLAKLNTRMVAYTFLNVCEKITSFSQVLKKDAHKRKLAFFFCLTVYIRRHRLLLQTE